MKRILSLSVVMFMSVAATSATAEDFPTPEVEYYVLNPFALPDARTNFLKCYEETTQEQLNAFARIEYWGYRFRQHPAGQCPPESPGCNPDVSWIQWRRDVVTNASEANPPGVFAAVRAHENGSCTRPVNIGNFSSNISLKRAEYRWHVRARKRACHPWGGSMTIAEGSADIMAGYDLQPDFSLTPFHLVTNEEGTFLGVFKGGLAEAIVTAVFGGLGGSITQLAGEIVRHDLMARLRDDDFAGIGINTAKYLIEGTLTRLNKVGTYEMAFVTQTGISGFRRSGDNVTVEYFQDAYIDSLFQDNAEKVRKLEIDFLKSLSEVSPESYVVQPGDNLWTLVGKKYGDPRLFLLVAEYNDRPPTMLKVGETLKLPRWYELCKKLKPKDLWVHDGESLWSKSKKGEVPYDLRRIVTRSGDPDLIYPYEQLQILP